MTETNNYKDEMAKKLEEGIKGVLESENFKNYLRTMSKHYKNGYSSSNSVLIYSQAKDASFVMGFEAWKEYGRSVKKGAKAIKIFAPSFAYEKKEGQLFNSIKAALKKDIKTKGRAEYASYRLGQSNFIFTMQHNGLYSLMISGKSVARFTGDEDLKRFIKSNILGKVPVYFRSSNIFDIKDTYEPEFLWLQKGKFKDKDLVLSDDGKPIKTSKGLYKVKNTAERRAKLNTSLDFSIKEIDDKKAKLLFSCLKSFSEKRGVPLSVQVIKRDGVDGYYQRPNENGEQKIVISNKLEASEKVAVAFHEIAHSILHKDLEGLANKMSLKEVNVHLREIQAEATAFMSASFFGIDTSTSSFNYLSMHTLGKDLTDFKISLDYIHNTSKEILNSVEKELELLGYNMKLEPKEDLDLTERKELKYSDIMKIRSDLDKNLIDNSISVARDDNEASNDLELDEDLEMEM